MLRKIIGTACLVFAWQQALFAVVATGVPEIDPATGVSAIVLLSGAVLILRSRRQKKG